MKAAVIPQSCATHARDALVVDGAITSPRRPTLRSQPELVALPASDGYPLTGSYYAARGQVRAHLVVAGAVGVPQRFYRCFAEVAAANQFSTLTLDYRGIGLSAPDSLKGFEMDYFDWGRIDLAAAVAAMSSRDLPLYVVGHSFGGHQFGVLPNHKQITAFYTFGTGAGWHGWMPPLERIRVLALWHIPTQAGPGARDARKRARRPADRGR